MAQTITVKVKMEPNKANDELLKNASRLYISTINQLVTEMVLDKNTTNKTTKHLTCDLPSAIKNQAIRDAKSVFQKAKKSKYSIIPVLKKPCLIWNNQNYSFDKNYISVPLMVNGKSVRVKMKTHFTADILALLSTSKLGTLRVTKKANKWIAQFSMEVMTPIRTGTKIMGVDLGLKVPAVAVTDDDKTKFFGNGRQNKFVRRKHKSKRKELGQKKKMNAIKSLDDKEQRWMKDQDHKVSRSIVNFAINHHVSVIRLEQLTNIRKTAKTSRKNERNIHNWSFYRLANFIEYKANLVGIQVEYVNPAYTSQTCPDCGHKNKAKDRSYTCTCGFNTHRDRVGAMNIRYAPVIDGKSLSA